MLRRWSSSFSYQGDARIATSAVLRCDDCIKYHLEKCFELGVTREQMFEIMSVANLVGGSIVIPHTRRAVEYWDLLEEEEAETKLNSI